MPTFRATGIGERISEHHRDTWHHLEHSIRSPQGSLPTYDAFLIASGRSLHRRITVKYLPTDFIGRIRTRLHSQRTAQAIRQSTGIESVGGRINLITNVGEARRHEIQPIGIPRAWTHPYQSTIYQILKTIAKAKSETTVSLKALSWPETRPTQEESQQHHSRLASEFKGHIDQAQGEVFTDGMDSTFAHRIHQSIKERGPIAVSIWERVINETGNAHETGEEFLRQLGILKDCPSLEARLKTLVNFLGHSDPRIRDAAGLGLSFLDDPNALPMLTNTHAREVEPWLKRNLGQVIEQLESWEWPDS